MKLDIGEAIENGFNRTLTRSAAYLTGLFFLVNLISRAMSDTIMNKMIEAGTISPQFEQLMGSQMANITPLATGLSMNIASAIGVITGLLSAIVTIGGIRLFLSDERESLGIDFFTDNLGWILLNVVVGAIAFSMILAAGFIAFIIPGLYLLAALYFWNFHIIDENSNFIEALKFSWRATRNNRMRSFALIFITTIAAGIFSTVAGGILGLIGGFAGSAIGAVLGLIPTTMATVFTLATFTEGYKQLKENALETENQTEESEEKETSEQDQEEDSSEEGQESEEESEE